MDEAQLSELLALRHDWLPRAKRERGWDTAHKATTLLDETLRRVVARQALFSTPLVGTRLQVCFFPFPLLLLRSSQALVDVMRYSLARYRQRREPPPLRDYWTLQAQLAVQHAASVAPDVDVEPPAREPSGKRQRLKGRCTFCRQGPVVQGFVTLAPVAGLRHRAILLCAAAPCLEILRQHVTITS